MAKKDLIREAYERWQEAREVTLILHETWAATIRSKKNIVTSAMQAGVKPAVADKIYLDALANAQQEYIQAFTRMCELSDEYTALTLNVPAPKKKK